MRIPLSWLAEWADLPPGLAPEALHAALVRVGFEEETVHGGDVIGPVVVGEVLSREPEPQKNGKTINWCQVRVGPDEVRGIVCGAHNFEAGDRVIVTLPGAVLPGPFPIAARKTYGHVSDGMIASARELGLSDEHEGILRLADLGIDAEVGTDAIALLGLDDAAVEINVTPDRGYALSIRGIAREYGASTGAAFRDPAAAVRPPDGREGGVPVTIADGAPIRDRPGCTVFVTRVVRGIDAAAPTPSWMSSRLRLAGIRSVSLAVDATNYAMVELGQPIHAYDLATLDGGLTVRRARPGEALVTLDGRERLLDGEDLVIADGTGAVGLAGVMGGARTEIGVGTTDVVIEAANFDPVSVGRTARRQKLPSEASRRFERGVDPQVARAAAQRVVDLLVALGGGVADDAQTWIDTSTPPAPVRLAPGAVEGRTGVAVTAEETAAALEALGMTLAPGGDGVLVTPPTWRPDVREAADVIEEVVRIVGYDRIPSELPVAPPGRGLTRAQVQRRSIARALAAAGAVEVQTYPFVAESEQAVFGGGGPSVRLVNPLDGGAPLLRRSLLPGLLDAVLVNRGRGFVDLALFESGAVFLPESGRTYGVADLPSVGVHPDAATLAALSDLPPQPVHVAAVFAGAQVPKQPGLAAEPAEWTDAVAAAGEVVAAVGGRLVLAQSEAPGFHPGRTAALSVEGDPAARTVGVAGELLPALAARLGVPGRIVAFEIDVDALAAALPGGTAFPAISPMPAATQDLSLVVAEPVAAADLRHAVVEGAGVLLESAEVVDVYRGAGLPADTKSVTFALRFRAPDRTLTAAEATAAKEAGVALAAERWGAAQR